MFYRLFRRIVVWALRLFYRLEVVGGDPSPEGPLIIVANHPNGLVDPGLLFALCPRAITFLAKAPLFRLPIIGVLLRALGALPVYRRQDAPGDMDKNASTLEASVQALVQGGVISVFPEGRSHSEPALGELRTGCARIALDAAAQGAKVRIVPWGLTYEQKELFRSRVRVEVGPALGVEPPGDDEALAVRELTGRIDGALREVTLNLERWEDLPLLRTAEALHALRLGAPTGDPERLRAFARGVAAVREKHPERFARLHQALLDYQRRLDLMRVGPRELTVAYRPAAVARFVARNLAALFLGVPIFAAGLLAFALPYQLPWLAARVSRVELDTEATVKLLVALVVAPAWMLGLAAAAWTLGGIGAGLGCALVAPALALFTRRFYERRAEAARDVRTFFALHSRHRLRGQLVDEGSRLADELEALAQA